MNFPSEAPGAVKLPFEPTTVPTPAPTNFVTTTVLMDPAQLEPTATPFSAEARVFTDLPEPLLADNHTQPRHLLPVPNQPFYLSERDEPELPAARRTFNPEHLDQGARPKSFLKNPEVSTIPVANYNEVLSQIAALSQKIDELSSTKSKKPSHNLAEYSSDSVSSRKGKSKKSKGKKCIQPRILLVTPLTTPLVTILVLPPVGKLEKLWLLRNLTISFA